MKWLGNGAMAVGLGCLNAQTTPASPTVNVEDVRKMLNDDNGDLARLARGLIGEGDTNRLFYFPTHDVPATPTKWGFSYDDVMFRSSDGTKLNGWFMPARGNTAKGTIVFSHGNAGSIGHHLGFVMWLVEAGYHVFLYDYRGFGKSEGVVNREGMVEDVKAAFDYVAGRADVDADHLISYGHSLGGAKSVTAIAEQKPRGLRGMVIDGAFASYRAMAVIVGGQFGASLITDELSPRDFISKINNTPLLVIHGDRDEVVPLSQGKTLFNLANEPKTLFEVKGGSHGNSLALDSGAYRKRMLEWLEGIR
ncbi:alpha/beta hydrolase [Luteolibacter algae]|uniref:Alpha/beta hydrolase n=1 Tax=Luteolibacter algae TaxID=454151 RepID=A0ABW5D6R0_9BACT